MGDCATLEQAFSHYVPALAGSLISTTLVAICLFTIDFRMALAAVWVLPIAFTITFLSARIQEYFNRKSVAANVALESGVQECIESLQDLKANNAEESYLKGLDKKIDNVEKQAYYNRTWDCPFRCFLYVDIKARDCYGCACRLCSTYSWGD